MRNDLAVEKMIKIIDNCKTTFRNSTMTSSAAIICWLRPACLTLGNWVRRQNKIDEEYEEAHPEIPWRQIYGLRNRIIHDYEGINLKLIWEIIQDDLPELLKHLEKL